MARNVTLNLGKFLRWIGLAVAVSVVSSELNKIKVPLPSFGSSDKPRSGALILVHGNDLVRAVAFGNAWALDLVQQTRFVAFAKGIIPNKPEFGK